MSRLKTFEGIVIADNKPNLGTRIPPAAWHTLYHKGGNTAQVCRTFSSKRLVNWFPLFLGDVESCLN